MAMGIATIPKVITDLREIIPKLLSGAVPRFFSKCHHPMKTRGTRRYFLIFDLVFSNPAAYIPGRFIEHPTHRF